jgi:hypothetical protein
MGELGHPELLRSLVEAIVFMSEDGELRIDLRGEIAGILTLAGREPGNKKAPLGAEALERIKVVAGRGAVRAEAVRGRGAFDLQVMRSGRA